MSRADELMGRFAGPPAAAAGADEPAAPRRPGKPERTTPIRQTFDLPPELHSELAAWRHDTAIQLGRPGQVYVQQTLTAMVRVLLGNDRVARLVRAEIERGST